MANSFGVLRVAMASLVLVSHSFLYRAGAEEAEPLFLLIGRSLGECAVEVFFILSGLMVAQSFDRSRGIVDFCAGRCLRIFPGLIVCVLVSAFMLGPIMTANTVGAYLADKGTYVYIAKTLMLTTGAASLPGVFETAPYGPYVNSSLWTLKYEVICYAGLAIAGLGGLLRTATRRRVALGIAALIVLLSVAARGGSHGQLIDNCAYFAIYFAGGVLAYLLRTELVLHWTGVAGLFAAFCALVGTSLQDAAAAAFLGYGALWLATWTFGPLRALCNRYDTSFGIYIYAGPTQQALLALFPTITVPVLTGAAFTIVLPVALASWLVIERPALGLRRAIGQRITPPVRLRAA